MVAEEGLEAGGLGRKTMAVPLSLLAALLATSGRAEEEELQ